MAAVPKAVSGLAARQIGLGQLPLQWILSTGPLETTTGRGKKVVDRTPWPAAGLDECWRA